MTKNPTDRGRLRGIEGLRAIAASSILVYHVWLYAAPGAVSVDLGAASKAFQNLLAGVTLFFVLSGFLLFRPYVEAAWTGGRQPALRAYLVNRALRIIPAYWVILIAVALLMQHELLSHPLQLLANLFFAQNYVTGYALGAGIVPAWSLAIEVVFYLAVPVLGGLAIRLARRRGVSPLAAAVTPVLLMVLLGIAAKAAVPLFHGDGARGVWQLSFLAHADWFAAGMAVAVLRVRWVHEGGRLFRGWRPAAVLMALGLLAVSMKLFYNGTLSALEYQSPIALGCALILAAVIFPGEHGRVTAILEWRPLKVAGLASYSLFLWHDPLVRALRDQGWTWSGRSGFLINLAVIGSISIAASALTYRFVERPALARKRAWQGGAARPRAARSRRTGPEAAPVSAPVEP